MRFKKNLQLIVTCFLSSTILFKVILVQFSAIALEFNDRNNITLNAENKIASDDRLSKSENLDASKNKIILIQSLKKADSNLQKNKQLSKLIPIELIAENDANLSDRSLLNSDKGDSPESKAQFKETLKDTNSDLQKTKRLSEFTRANVIPIDVIAENNANLSDRSLLNSDKGDSPESKAQLKETLKDANSDLQKTKRLSEFTRANVIPIEVIAANNANLSDRSLLNSDKVDSPESKALLKETLKDANSNLQKIKQLSEFTIADVIPIEEYKVEPPKPPDEGEEQTKPNTTKPNVPAQQILIQKLRRSKKQQQTQQQKIIIDALTFSANKYPWIVNPTDNLTFSTELFKPNENENYIDTDISLKFSGDNQIINKFTYAKFPKADQFYWVLDNNRIVVETKGSQIGILSQGRETNTYITQNVTSQQAFWGLQTLFAIPTDFQNLFGTVDAQNFSITSIAGQLVNPEGVPAGRVTINSGINENNPNVTVLRNPILAIGSGSTLSVDGGQALFQALDAVNAPKILQGFPTTNIQPLLDGGNVKLKIGEVIPNSALEAAGISWGNILTGEGFGFTAPVSSLPGIKVAQLGKFDNFDLLNVAVNPFLSQSQKDYHYLNSLQWVSLGRRQPVFETLSQTQESSDWHRLYVSRPHNRSLIQYDPVAIKATYSNIFSAPGLSLTAKFSDTSLDAIQSVNSTLGLLLGEVFEAIKIDNIQQGLQEAREKLKNGEDFTSLNTTATSEQRRQINNRLNRTLSYANASSGLEQVSGTYTFPSQVTPKNSSILQIRTGNHKRAVQFLERDISILNEGNTFFSDLRLSNEKFGPLTYIGLPIPLNDTSIDPVNESSAAEVILTNAQGQQFVEKFNSADSTIVPIQVRAADLAFDYMELTRVDKIGVSFNSFNGYLSLPTVELLAAGSSGNFNYSANVGTWFNIDANSAPGVSNNNLGIEEPTLGFYTNILLNYIKTDVRLNSAKKPVAVNTHVPYLRVDWNSASNRNNPFSTYLSYLYQHQERNFGFSLAPGIAFIENNSNGDFLGLFNGEFSTSHGLNIKTSLEMGKEYFFQFQGLHRVSKNISAGIYLKNYSINNLGLSSRVSGFNYGVILRHSFPDNSVFIETQIGTGENGFDIELQGGYRF
ncbi:hypothetical protein [Nostoc sp. 'Peltigera membranacea cyanobiont' 232]|uniref:hypothetical protein n=1 Tax=Nostoc sp. 'Peltigera membranacea cyanobiont' 232 TaxID=2014531 RepID=UPI001671D807|nr:hypothetical protein [Nostoc sp. 'Peltigera membranacea cyanobiont' 232]